MQVCWRVGKGGVYGEVVAAPDPDRPGAYAVHRLYVHPWARGRGWGRVLMEKLVGWADQHGQELTLYVSRIGKGGLSNRELEDFYARYGFRRLPRADWVHRRMIRRCQASESKAA